MLREVTEKIIRLENLSRNQAFRVMDYIMDGKATDSQLACFLTAINMKGETAEEISGFARAMLAKAEKFDIGYNPVVDTCGTGGDKKNTFNISTTAAFIAAGAGVVIAKHGNRSVSSRSGSADVLEKLGVNINLSAKHIVNCIAKIGIGFIYAPNAHAAMANVARARKEMGIKTVFNILGPLTNPSLAGGRVLGVYDENIMEKMALALKDLGINRALVVHGREALDEISVFGKTLILELNKGSISRYEICPGDFGLKSYGLEGIRGGDAGKNAEILLNILMGRQKGAKRAAALLNSAAAIIAGGKADNFYEGIDMAAESIDSGKALDKLNQLIDYTKKY